MPAHVGWWLRMGRARWVAVLTTSLIVLTCIGVLVGSRYALGVALNTLVALVFLAACGSLLFGVIEVSSMLLGVSRDTRNRLRLLLGTILLLLTMTELVLRFGVRRYVTYPEQNGFMYGSLYAPRNPSWYYAFDGLSEVKYSKTEFDYHRAVNSMGLCEREIPLDKEAGEYRVLALGDSFTEGVGTSYDTTWLKVLERHLVAAMPDRPVTTINAGISGSDPFYAYVLLRDRLLPYKPDLVIVAVNSSDMYDVLIRGGMERFRPGGVTHYARQAPKWELLYATSYIVRIVVHEVLGYNWLLIKDSEMEAPTRVAADEIVSVLADFQKLADERDFKLLVVLHPVSYYELIYDQYSNGFDLVASRMKKNEDIKSLDLFEYYRRTGIMTKENARDFFWSVDGHNNTDGYRVMGDAIAKTVVGSLSLPRGQQSSVLGIRDESEEPEDDLPSDRRPVFH